VTREILDRIEDMSDLLAAEGPKAEQLGRLSDETVKGLKTCGVMRMLQPKKYGGFESHPNDFLKAVMAIAAKDSATGWIAGIVGVHPWETALTDDRLQAELWAEDPTVWMASPYAPMGVAVPTDEGFVLNGRWSFSSGTDHCDWVVLGALLGGADGAPVMPPEMLHVMLPRADYQIVEDSWNVVGLQGTGSKDVIVENAFIPSYRSIDAHKVMDGRAAVESGRSEPLYRMPWTAIFPGAIAAAVTGICEGMLASALAYQKDRVSMSGPAKADPHVLSAIGEAAAEIRSSRVTLLYNIDEMFDLVSSGGEVSLEMRAAGRRDQVRGAWRAVRAANEVFTRCGGTALRTDTPIHRFWRDANAGLNHAVFTTGPVYHGATAVSMGVVNEVQLAQALIA
jgi:3-hydroxy-9,10-secoandrosta-1,3,5(10)-triene-9,17-dione monooxygenase